MSSALQEIRKAEDAIYEIQELRHTTASSQTSQINELFASLEAQIERIRELVSQSHAIDTEDGCGQARVQSDETALQQDRRAQEAWAAFEKRWNTLRDEMKEDGWLVRFRTTAEQAEAMMDSLAKSATEMVQTVQQHEAGLVADEGYAQLVRTLKGHLAMRSISKILKMMDRSLADRATKNGEALRRHGDMTARWTTLQHDLRAVEGRARIVLEQQAPHDSGVSSAPKILNGAGGDGAIADSLEMLAESLSLHDDSPGSRHTSVHTSTLQLHPQHPQHPPSEPASIASSSLGSRTNPSDIHAARSLLSPPVAGSRYPSLGSAAHPGGPPTLRRRVSQTSLVSTTTAATNSERPRWNGSTRVHHPASTSASTSASAPASAAGEQTPGTAKRRLTMTGAATPSRPSRSGATTPSSAMPSVTPSKIPAPRARPSLSNRLSMAGHTDGSLTPRRSIPGLAVSTTSSRISLSHPSGRDTAIPPVPALPARTPSRHTNRPSLANDAAGMPPPYHTNRTSATATVTPHRPRQSLARGPPSAYRPGSVSSPQGRGVPPMPRPSSRMSTGAASVAGSAYGYGNTPHDDLVPFVPSKYDLLDGCVAQVLADNAFEHFVARVDPPLKKGQRRGENEEWKGTYVFGSAGERGTPVKMMQLASRDGGKISKVLARRAGQWVPLTEVLDERKEKYDEVF